MTPKAYGHVARLLRNVPFSANALGFNPRIEEVTIRRRGPSGVVQRAASLFPGFIELVAIEAYTREEWARCFGGGRS